jgi:hypothetical protein
MQRASQTTLTGPDPRSDNATPPHPIAKAPACPWCADTAGEPWAPLLPVLPRQYQRRITSRPAARAARATASAPCMFPQAIDLTIEVGVACMRHAVLTGAEGGARIIRGHGTSDRSVHGRAGPRALGTAHARTEISD